MPSIEHDGIQFNYNLVGSGPTVIFTHGLTGDLQQAADTVGLLPGYSLFCWDVRGHGLSHPFGPAEKLNFSSFAKDLNAILDRLGIESAVVAGVSMGAAISARFAIDYPERARGLVLVRPAWLEEPLPEGLKLLPRIAEYMEQFGEDRGLEEFTKLPELEEVRRIFPDTADGLLQQFHKPHAMERRARLQRIPADAPIRDWTEVASLTMPALVFGNEPDYLHPLSFAMAWAEHLPKGRFAEIPSKFIQPEEHLKALRVELNKFLQSLEDQPKTLTANEHTR